MQVFHWCQSRGKAGDKRSAAPCPALALHPGIFFWSWRRWYGAGSGIIPWCGCSPLKLSLERPNPLMAWPLHSGYGVSPLSWVQNTLWKNARLRSQVHASVSTLPTPARRCACVALPSAVGGCGDTGQGHGHRVPTPSFCVTLGTAEGPGKPQSCPRRMLHPGPVHGPQAWQTTSSKALEESSPSWASPFPRLKAEAVTISGAVSLRKESRTPQSISSAAAPCSGQRKWVMARVALAFPRPGRGCVPRTSASGLPGVTGVSFHVLGTPAWRGCAWRMTLKPSFPTEKHSEKASQWHRDNLAGPLLHLQSFIASSQAGREWVGGWGHPTRPRSWSPSPKLYSLKGL